MKMYSLSKKDYSKVIFDSQNIPKSYNIEVGKYEIEILDEAQYKILPLQPVKPQTMEKIEDLINSLCYAAHGYKDCEMSSKKFQKLIECFSDPISGGKMVDFKFKPKLRIKI